MGLKTEVLLTKFENEEKIINILNKHTHKHMGTSATPCVFDFQFKEIANEIINSIK